MSNILRVIACVLVSYRYSEVCPVIRWVILNSFFAFRFPMGSFFPALDRQTRTFQLYWQVFYTLSQPFKMSILHSGMMAFLLLSVADLFMSSVLVSAESNSTPINNSSSSSSCDSLIPSIPRWKMPDCVVVGTPVESAHVIDDDQTATFKGELFSMQVTGDWGDGTSPVSELVEGLVGGQNHTTSFNHTYGTVGNFSTRFGFEALLPPEGGTSSLDCLGIINPYNVSLDVEVKEKCEFPPPTNSGTKTNRLHQANSIVNVVAWSCLLVYML